MVIATDEKRELRIYRNQMIYGINAQPYYNVTLQVVREATREEYLEYCNEIGVTRPNVNAAFFYEILMD